MTPTAATPTMHRVLERWTAQRLPIGTGPYDGIDVDGDGDRDEWRSNWRYLYVRREGAHIVSLKPKHGYAKLLTAAELEAVRATAARRGWKLRIEAHPLTIDRELYPHLGGDLDCNADLLRALNAAAVELTRTTGHHVEIWVQSGARDLAEQWALWTANMHQVNGVWVPRPGHALTAYPSATAPHVRKIAADCSIAGQNIGTWDSGRARKALDRAGACLCVPSEAWHVQLKSTAAWASNWRPA